MSNLPTVTRFVQLILVKHSPFHGKLASSQLDIEESYILACEGLDRYTDVVCRSVVTIDRITSLNIIVPKRWSYDTSGFDYNKVMVDAIVDRDGTVWVTEATHLRIHFFES